MEGRDEIPVAGVTALDHTADVGLEAVAPSLPELFRRCALGTLWLVLESEPQGGEVSVRRVEEEAEDLDGLLRRWLRTLLFLHETEGFVTTDARVSVVPSAPKAGSPPPGFLLRAEVEGRRGPWPPVREIKGVTFHGLEVAEGEGGWRARVIFDV